MPLSRPVPTHRLRLSRGRIIDSGLLFSIKRSTVSGRDPATRQTRHPMATRTEDLFRQATASSRQVSQDARPAGLPLPPIMYGTAWKKERTAELVYQAIKAGFRGIDTAAMGKHYREDLVGEGIRKAIAEGIVKRQDLYVSPLLPLTIESRSVGLGENGEGRELHHLKGVYNRQVIKSQPSFRGNWSP